ncbi:MAG: hypothetical protein OXC68_01975, partial [Aestuariivita sp.]|nr:hypothetical protein [Aestuariivita sp.]
MSARAAFASGGRLFAADTSCNVLDPFPSIKDRRCSGVAVDRLERQGPGPMLQGNPTLFFATFLLTTRVS